MAPVARRAVFAAALASTLRYGMASDGHSCPRDEPGCLDHDDGSLLQLASRRHPVVLDASKEAGDMRDSVCPQVGGRAWFSARAFDYIVQRVFPFAIHDAEAMVLPVGAISGESGGTAYLLDNMQLHAMSAQAADIQLVEGQGVQLALSGLAAKVTMRYDLSSSGLFKFASKGDLSVSIGKGTSASLFIGFGVNEAGNPTILPQDVRVRVNIAGMRFRGARPGLTAIMNALGGVLRPLIEQQIQAAVVQAMNRYSNSDVNSLIASFDFGIPMKHDEPAPWNVAVKVCSVQITCCYIVADFYTAVEGADVYPDSPKNLLPTSAEIMASSMFGATVAEWTVQGAAWFAQKSGVMNASFKDLEGTKSFGDGLSLSAYTALDISVTVPPLFDFIETGFNVNLEAQLELVQEGDDSAAVSVATPVSTAARYADGQTSFKILSDGEPQDFHLGQGAPTSLRDEDASFWSSLLVDTADEKMHTFVKQLLDMNSDGSAGLQIKDLALHFTDDEVTALVNAVEVDIEQLVGSFLGAVSAAHLTSGH